MFFFVCNLVTGLVVAVWLLKELTMGICRSRKRVDGKVAVVTGAASGIGYETALELARRGAEVVIADKNAKQGEQARNAIVAETGNESVHSMAVDLSLQRDVERFAKEVCDRFPRLHYLVNNAGVGPESLFGGSDVRKESRDKRELIMATNYLGHFSLTHHLLKKLLASGEPDSPTRVINVSSVANVFGRFDADSFDINGLKAERYRGGMQQYSNSKLLLIHFANELARRCEGTNTQSASLHPGEDELLYRERAQCCGGRWSKWH